jgi:FAD/FMN-containing dehydrogenase
VTAAGADAIARREAFVRAFRQRLARRRDGGGDPATLGKSRSNLFRTRTSRGRLDAAQLGHVLSVDVDARTADVEGMAPYDRVVAATLRHGLLPAVVPELKSITVGGAIAGVGVESSSFRHGFVHETAEELEVLTGDGSLLSCTPRNEHHDLFFGMANSYGTLGYVLRARIRLVPARPFVELRHLRFTGLEECFTAVSRIAAAGAPDAPDFLDGVVFGDRECYLTLGRFVDAAPFASDYSYLRIYYRSIRERSRDFLSASGYVWRWDADWFWCSRPFGMENLLLRAVLGKVCLSSRFYWKVMHLYRKHRIEARWNRMRGRRTTPREPVIQDVEIPVEGAAACVDFLLREIGVAPIWICPVRTSPIGGRFPLYAMDPGRLYVNLGFWGSVPLAPGQRAGDPNRAIERRVAELGGRKSLYSTSFYRQEEFWRTYGGDEYHALKRRYDPERFLPDLYEKCVEGR